MKVLTISEVVKKPAQFTTLVKSGEEVRIVWKEQKPNGKVELSAIIKKEDNKNV